MAAPSTTKVMNDRLTALGKEKDGAFSRVGALVGK